MPRQKGLPKTGGRKPGSLNKATAEAKMAIEDLAKTHAPDALASLVNVALNGQSESARVSAAVALLERGYGKPRQQVEHSGLSSIAINLGRGADSQS